MAKPVPRRPKVSKPPPKPEPFDEPDNPFGNNFYPLAGMQMGPNSPYNTDNPFVGNDDLGGYSLANLEQALRNQPPPQRMPSDAELRMTMKLLGLEY